MEPEGTPSAIAEGRLVNYTMDAKDHNAHFDGSDDYINAGNDASVNITGPITLEAWIKADSTSTNYGRIIHKNQYNSINGYMLSLRPGGGIHLELHCTDGVRYKLGSDAVDVTDQDLLPSPAPLP